jgi:hypothetical protein
MRRFGNRYTADNSQSARIKHQGWRALAGARGQTGSLTNQSLGSGSVVARTFYCPCPEPPTPQPLPPPIPDPFWARFGVPSEPRWLMTDSNDRCIIVGYWSDVSSMLFYDDGGNLQGSQISSQPRFTSFISVYEPTGTLAWTARIESTVISITSGITDIDGNITVLGYFYNDEGSPTTTLTAWNADNITSTSRIALENTNLFVIQYSPTGTVRWIARMSMPVGKTGQNVDDIYLCLANNTDIVVCGFYTVFSGPSYLSIYDQADVETQLPISARDQYLFLARYTQNGNLGFATSVTCGTDPTKAETLRTNGLIVSGSTAIITGYGTFTSLTAGGTITLPGSYPFQKDFVIGFNCNSGIGLWGAYMDPSSLAYSYAPQFREIYMGQTRAIYTGITTSNPILFRDPAGVPLLAPITPAAFQSIYLTNIDVAGTHYWATKIDGTVGSNIPLGITMYTDNYIYMLIFQRSDSMYLYDAPGSALPALTVTTPSPGENVLTLCAFTGNGVVRWARTCNVGGAFDQARLSVDTLGNPLLFFPINADVNFYTDETSTVVQKTSTGRGVFDTVAAKYTSNGVLEWAGLIGGDQSDFIRWMEPTQKGGMYTLTSTFSSPVLVIDADGVQRVSFTGISYPSYYAVVCWPSSGS